MHQIKANESINAEAVSYLTLLSVLTNDQLPNETLLASSYR